MTSRAARERTIGRWMAALAVPVLLVLAFVLSGGRPTVPFWAVTAIAVGYGALGVWLTRRVRGRLVANLFMAGLLGGLFFLVSPAGPAPVGGWVFGIAAGVALVSALSPERPPRRTEPPTPVTDVRPWSGGGLKASLTTIASGIRGRMTLAVRVHTDEVTSVIDIRGLTDAVDGRVVTAESVRRHPLVFLARTGGFATSSLAEEVTRGMPDGALVLMLGSSTAPPRVVLTGDVCRSFEDWVHALPEASTETPGARRGVAIPDDALGGSSDPHGNV